METLIVRHNGRRHAVLLGVLLFAAGSTSASTISGAVLRAAYERLTPAICLVEFSTQITAPDSGRQSKRSSSALGLLVSPDGLVMTHGHMVRMNTTPFNISVRVGQGEDERRFDARALHKPDDVNVVFLRIEAGDAAPFDYVRFHNPSGLQLGQEVAIIGLLGETLDYCPGIFMARVGAVLEDPRTAYCLDRNIRFGYVGGPVLDAQGRVSGVLGFDLSPSEGGDVYIRSGHPLLYQSELFRSYITEPPDDAQQPEAGDYAWLGVFTQPLKDDYARYWDLEPKGGLIVSTVVPGSPAAGIGVQPGDVIVRFDGTPIRAKQDSDVMGFTRLVRDTGPGKEVPLRVLRGGETLDLRVTLGTRPRMAQEADEYEEPHFGLTVREITTDLRIALNLSEDVRGVLVRRVESGSVAKMARIAPGVIIMAVGEYPVASVAAFREAIQKVAEEKPAEVALFGRVGSATGFFRLAPRWEDDA